MRFEVDKTYETHCAAAHGWRPRFTVIARTARFITIMDEFDDVKRVGVKVSDGDEWALPFGSYSMAPVLRASRIVETVAW